MNGANQLSERSEILPGNCLQTSEGLSGWLGVEISVYRFHTEMDMHVCMYVRSRLQTNLYTYMIQDSGK